MLGSSTAAGIQQQAALKAVEVCWSMKPSDKAAALEHIHSLAPQTGCDYLLDTIQSKESGRASLRALTAWSDTDTTIIFKYRSELPTTANGKPGQGGEDTDGHLTLRLCPGRGEMRPSLLGPEVAEGTAVGRKAQSLHLGGGLCSLLPSHPSHLQ